MTKLNPKTFKLFISIIFLSLLALIINLPDQIPLKFNLFKYQVDRTITIPSRIIKFNDRNIDFNPPLHYGLDLAGGVSLIFSIDTSQTSADNLPSALESLKSNIERRINYFGLTESSIQLSNQNGQHRLIVDIPGIQETNEAISLVGKTASLSFRGEVVIPPEATASATIYDLFSKDTGLNGSHLIKALPQIDENTSEPVIALEFNAEGARLFQQATTDYLNKRIAIFVDDLPLMYPTVESVISDGQAVIKGSFDTKSTKLFAAQLNAGALPLSVSPIKQLTVNPTLGQDSIRKGIIAGLIGLALVCLFMIGNYGYLGFIADISLLIYALISLTLFRLIPVTLTFSGIVGFILSIGMAVDSNILIFERFKEELRSGKPWNMGLELAFGHAWDSIKDANLCTIITGLILFNPLNWTFLNSSGMVRGFAFTLLLGVIISIFTGVVVTRNLLRVLARQKT